jgi:hypothetical protein
VLVVFERVGEVADALVHPAHRGDLVLGHAGADEQVAVLRVFEPAGAVARLPPVHEDFGVLRLVAQLLRQPAVILVRVREHDAADVGRPHALAPQPLAQGLQSLPRLRPRVD